MTDRPRVLITRSEAGPVVAALEAGGCEVVCVPLIERKNLAQAAKRCAEACAAPDVLLLTSAAAIEAIGRSHDLIQPARVAAVGPATAARAAAFGWRVDVVPENGSGEALVAALGPLGGQTVLFPSAEDAAQGTLDALAASGAVVHRLIVYQNVEPADAGAKLRAAGPVDLVILYAPSAARRLAAHREDRPPVVTIGPSTATEARALGYPIAGVAAQPTPDTVVKTALVALGRG